MARIEDWETESGITLITGWKRDGLSNVQIAENIGISEATLYRWKNKSESIERALETGKEIANFHVENALFKMATGFFYDEITTENSETRSYKKTVRKYAPPNVKAIEIWLKTKWPERYAQKESLEIEQLKREIERLSELEAPVLDRLDAVLAKISGNAGKIV